MDALGRERDRLLQRSARMVGTASTLVSFLCFLVPGLVEADILFAVVPLFIVLLAVHLLIGNSRSLPLVCAGLVAGLAILAVVQIPGSAEPNATLLNAMSPLAAGGLSSFTMVLLEGRWRHTVLAVAYILSLGLMVSAAPTDDLAARVAILVTFGWALTTVFAYWLNASVPRAARRIRSIGRAHMAERRASETEAQRRQGARLLHDTVLATLTLLAHSGVGVSADSMRQQAADDARLLRQLRLGVTVNPSSSGNYNLEPVAETPLGTTLESVKQRFGRMGLEVAWHGTGHVLLPSDVLDAFLLALSECLENVRRHAGVSNAHVTITEDETTVRAMVTDQGIGFVLEEVDEQSLGYKESIVGRLKEVGGNARLFSAPGAGTTVVLEVPRT
ncbi:sensor histidine kinase [Salinibacterium hongtaonis]|uniref:Histidine kinase n=1 Tax=Homoserinimonas hongtaonis TaxID=2079791 RepID=A0A2U1SX59_9MICO|nr:ATP-binding protein [Salinibacterium hongtaonis]AWB88785.1 histidine kinase [Salinibacterium hongtaonis]PWB96186.1 histidine kinase [Salinibacterium hongtaonis]